MSLPSGPLNASTLCYLWRFASPRTKAVSLCSSAKPSSPSSASSLPKCNGLRPSKCHSLSTGYCCLGPLGSEESRLLLSDHEVGDAAIRTRDVGHFPAGNGLQVGWFTESKPLLPTARFPLLCFL